MTKKSERKRDRKALKGMDAHPKIWIPMHSGVRISGIILALKSTSREQEGAK